jgi:hypothetical protein
MPATLRHFGVKANDVARANSFIAGALQYERGQW